MKIHEYQAKEIIEQYGITTPTSFIATTPDEAKTAFSKINKKVAIKAQVHAGGRGKAGGVKMAESPDDAYNKAKDILALTIKTLPVNKVMVVEAISVAKEYYVGITLDRETKRIVIMASKEGGVDIEEVAASTPEKIIKEYIDPTIGLKSYNIRQLATGLFDEKSHQKEAASVIAKLYNIFIDKDCSLIEINPLVKTTDDKVIALDSKINFDENALYRHPELKELLELDPDEIDEYEAKEHGLSFIPLDGDIGCIVNGAGLAMATMDIIKLFGGEPANFLDVGGSSNPNKIVKAFDIILRNKNVKAVLINIFGGITRCDDIANGLLKAYENMDINVPVVIRVTGNNEEEALRILNDAKMQVFTDLESAVKKVVSL